MKAGRYFIVIGLALLLIGVAYVRALFSHQDRSRITETQSTGYVSDSTGKSVGRQETSTPVDSSRRDYIDSSKTSVQQDSLAGLQMVSSFVTDSLKEEIGRLNDSLNIVTTRNEERLGKVMVDFCNGEIASLPADLSRYERTVSVKEIKSKAVKYFDIPMDSLNGLLAKAKKR